MPADLKTLWATSSSGQERLQQVLCSQASHNLAQALADKDAQRRRCFTTSQFIDTGNASQSFFLTGGVGPSSEFDGTRCSPEDL